MLTDLIVESFFVFLEDTSTDTTLTKKVKFRLKGFRQCFPDTEKRIDQPLSFGYESRPWFIISPKDFVTISKSIRKFPSPPERLCEWLMTQQNRVLSLVWGTKTNKNVEGVESNKKVHTLFSINITVDPAATTHPTTHVQLEATRTVFH